MYVNYYIYNKIIQQYVKFDAIKITKDGKVFSVIDNPQEHFENELKEDEYALSLFIGENVGNFFEKSISNR